MRLTRAVVVLAGCPVASPEGASDSTAVGGAGVAAAGCEEVPRKIAEDMGPGVVLGAW